MEVVGKYINRLCVKNLLLCMLIKQQDVYKMKKKISSAEDVINTSYLKNPEDGSIKMFRRSADYV